MLQCVQLPGLGIVTRLSQIVDEILSYLHDCLRARRRLIFWHGALPLLSTACQLPAGKAMSDLLAWCFATAFYCLPTACGQGDV